MSTILTIAGIFAGIGVFMAAMYSLTQTLLLRGAARWLHLVSLVLIVVVMGALMERTIPMARLLALPLIAVSAVLLIREPGWYRIFPALVIVFALLLILGYVALN